MSGRQTPLNANPAAIIAVGVAAAALVFFLQLVVRDRSVAWAGGAAVALLILFAARAMIVGRRSS